MSGVWKDMKGVTVGLLMLAAVGSFGQTITERQSRSDYNRLYDPRSVVTVTGKVTGVLTDSAIQANSNSVMLLVKADNGGTASIDLGPTWYINNQKEQIKVRDTVRVTGSKIFVGNNSYILAQQLVKGDRVLYLRELDGFPMWVASRGTVTVQRNPSANEPEPISAQILGVETRPGFNGQPSQRFLVVQTASGPMNILLGPEWFVANQNMSFRVGDNITVRGNPRQMPGNPNMMLVDSVVHGNSVITIQSNGVPVWNPWGGG